MPKSNPASVITIYVTWRILFSEPMKWFLQILLWLLRRLGEIICNFLYRVPSLDNEYITSPSHGLWEQESEAEISPSLDRWRERSRAAWWRLLSAHISLWCLPGTFCGFCAIDFPRVQWVCSLGDSASFSSGNEGIISLNVTLPLLSRLLSGDS